MKKILPYLMLAMLIASAAHGATAYRYSDSVTTVRGDAVGGASVTVYNAGTTTKATLYLYPSSEAGTKGNPTYTDGYGRFSFYLAPGIYDLVISGTNITSYTVEDVRIFSDTGYTFNVLDYGAIPDDGIDDTVAFRGAVSAVTSAGRGNIVVPDGRFHITQLVIPSGTDNLRLSGLSSGSSIVSTTLSDSMTIDCNADSMTIDGLTFIGMADSATDNIHGVSVSGDGFVLNNCAFTGPDSTKGYTIQVHLANSDDFRITNNRFDRIRGQLSGAGYGILVETCNRGIISGNIGTQTNTKGRHHVYLSAGTSNVVVDGNVFTGGTSQLLQMYTNDSQVRSKNNIFSNNILSGGVDGPGTGGGIVLVGNISNAIVSNNVIRGNEGFGIKAEGGAAYPDSVNLKDVTIIGNKIFDVGEEGIYVLGAARTSVVSNTVVDCGTVTPSVAIRLLDTGTALVDGSLIDGNSVSGSGHTVALQVDGAGVVVGTNKLVKGSAELVVNYASNWASAPSVYFGATAPTDTTGMRGQLMWFDPTGGDTLKIYTGTAGDLWKALH